MVAVVMGYENDVRGDARFFEAVAVLAGPAAAEWVDENARAFLGGDEEA